MTQYKDMSFFNTIYKIRKDIQEEREKIEQIEKERRVLQTQGLVKTKKFKEIITEGGKVFRHGPEFNYDVIKNNYLPVSKYELDRLNVDFKKYYKFRKAEGTAGAKNKKSTQDKEERAAVVNSVANKMLKVMEA